MKEGFAGDLRREKWFFKISTGRIKRSGCSKFCRAQLY